MENKDKEEVKAELVDKDEKPAKKGDSEKKAYNQDNLTKSIIFAAIITALQITHGILSAVGISGNITWFILNLLFTAGAAVIALFSGLFFFKVTKDNLKNDIPSFVVSLAAFVVSVLSAFGWSIDMIRNFIGMIQDFANSVA